MILLVSVLAGMMNIGIECVDSDRARVSPSEWCDERKEIFEYEDIGEERSSGTDSIIETGLISELTGLPGGIPDLAGETGGASARSLLAVLASCC